MKKRGYFFTIDVSIAMVIIVIGFLLIWSFYVTETKKVQPYFYARDAISLLSDTPVAAVTGTTPYIQGLARDGNITNLDNTLLEQIALSYIKDNGKLDMSPCGGPPCKTYTAHNITRHVLQDVVPEQYGVEVLFNHTQLYPINSSLYKWQNESDLLISAKKMVVVVLNKVNLSEPYIMEVRVWR